MQQINRILKNVMADKLAKEFSFFGTRLKKKSFNELQLKEVIIGKYSSIKKNSRVSHNE